MPPLPDAARVIKIEWIGTVSTTAFTCRLHALYTGGPPSDSALVDLDTAQGATLDRPFNHECGANMELTSRTYTDLTSPTAAFASVPKAVGGTTGGTPYPANVAAVINFKIARRYRGGHPRMYMPGMSSGSALSESQWTSSFVTNLQNDWLAVIAGLNGYSSPTIASLTCVNLSYFSGGALRSSPITDPILTASAQQRICTQRRRLGSL